MICRYCGSSNETGDHRCRQCGRRVTVGSARPAPVVYPSAGALPAEPAPVATPSFVAKQSQGDARRRAHYQTALFTTRELGRVVPIDGGGGGAIAVEPGPVLRQTSRRNPDRTVRSTEAVIDGLRQQPLFSPATVLARNASSFNPGNSRTSNAPVALLTHRLLAAVLDFSLVLVGVGMVAMVTHALIGLDFLLDRTLPFFGALTVFFAVAYKLMWAIAGADSPGLRWTHLRLLTFDGIRAVREDRLRRLCWSLISILPGCLGLLWATVDEEALSWHDHSSKTFLSPYSRL